MTSLTETSRFYPLTHTALMRKRTASGVKSEMYDVKTKEGRDLFLSDYWDLLAYTAYEGYALHQRGAVVIRGDKSGPEFLRYVPLGADFGNDEIEQCVRQYDPEHEIVFVFALEGFETAFGRYRAENPDRAPLLVYLALRPT